MSIFQQCGSSLFHALEPKLNKSSCVLISPFNFAKMIQSYWVHYIKYVRQKQRLNFVLCKSKIFEN